MATRFTSPITQYVNDDASNTGSGWKLNFYSTGTLTRKDTFSDTALTSANANPVVADSSGRFADIFLESGTYKVVLTDDTDVEKWTADPVEGSVGASGAVDSKTASYTVVVDDSTKFISVDATSGNLTVTLLASATAGNGFEVGVGKSDSSTNTVTVDGNGAETVGSSATYVLRVQDEAVTIRADGSNWAIQSTAFENTYTTTQKWAKGADVASATALAILADGNSFDVTGTTAITSIATTGNIGTGIKLHFNDAVLLTYDATNLVLPGGANITTAAGDEFEFEEYAAGDWRVTGYALANGKAIAESASFTESFTSSNQTITAAGSLAVAHSLSAEPTLIQLRLICTDAGGEHGYSQNDEVVTGPGQPSINRGMAIVPDATNVNIRFGSAAASISITDKSSGATAAITNTKWALIIKAWV